MSDRPLEPGDNFARRTDPITSHVAAAISSKRKGTADRLILEWLRDNPGSGGTTLEISREIDRAHNNISPRFKRLEEARLVHRSKDKRRDSKTRCESIVWRIGAAPRTEPEQGVLFA